MGAKYLSQDGGCCCFVYAVANCLIHNNLSVPDLERAFDIAACRNGNTIHYQAVIDYMRASLVPVDDHKLVLKRGGILHIMHPIWNGHALFCYPLDSGITIINSWLGPNVIEVGASEIEKFVPCRNFCKHWVCDAR